MKDTIVYSGAEVWHISKMSCFLLQGEEELGVCKYQPSSKTK